ncbi:hypothetical protein [Microbacterium sp. GXF0217]
MYEHPSLTITAMLEEQQMLNRAVERRRAILERLETQGMLRPSWFERIRAALRPGTRKSAVRPAEFASSDSAGRTPAPAPAR